MAEGQLTNTGGGLLGGQIGWAARDPEGGEAGGDGAGGDQDDLAAGQPAGGYRVDQGVQASGVEAAFGGGQGGRADLHDDASGGGHGVTHPTILRRAGPTAPPGSHIVRRHEAG